MQPHAAPTVAPSLHPQAGVGTIRAASEGVRCIAQRRPPAFVSCFFLSRFFLGGGIVTIKHAYQHAASFFSCAFHSNGQALPFNFTHTPKILSQPSSRNPRPPAPGPRRPLVHRPYKCGGGNHDANGRCRRQPTLHALPPPCLLLFAYVHACEHASMWVSVCACVNAHA